jgi:hypothetical protein
MAWPKDIWFRAYLKGNLLMPQTYAAGALFLARTVIEQNELEELKKATDLSPSQIACMRRVMQAAHRVRRIPAGDCRFIEQAREHGEHDLSRTILIDDDKLQYIWNRFRQRAIDLVERLTQRPEGLLIANQLAAGFQTKECRSLLRQFSAEYDRRRDGSDRAALILRKSIFMYVDNQVEPAQQKGLLQELFETE